MALEAFASSTLRLVTPMNDTATRDAGTPHAAATVAAHAGTLSCACETTPAREMMPLSVTVLLNDTGQANHG